MNSTISSGWNLKKIEAAEKEREEKFSAKEFTLRDAVVAFKLTYSDIMSESKKYI